MQSRFKTQHWNDAKGNPAGGSTFGNGFAISWQNGPLGRCTCVPAEKHPTNTGCQRREPNGAFVEDIIAAAKDRIDYYQDSAFACYENEQAGTYLSLALSALNERTAKREARAVEGTHVA